jgi:hypothetical protein
LLSYALHALLLLAREQKLQASFITPKQIDHPERSPTIAGHTLQLAHGSL